MSLKTLRLLENAVKLSSVPSCYLSSSSKIVNSEIMDLKLPNLTFHEMCFSREDKWGNRTALVSSLKLREHYNICVFRLMQWEETPTPCQKPILCQNHLVMDCCPWEPRLEMWLLSFFQICQSMLWSCWVLQKLLWLSPPSIQLILQVRNVEEMCRSPGNVRKCGPTSYNAM